MRKKLDYTITIDLSGRNNFQFKKGDNNFLLRKDIEIRKNLATLTEEYNGVIYPPKGHYFKAKFKEEKCATNCSSKAKDIIEDFLGEQIKRIVIEIKNGKRLKKYYNRYSEN